MDRIRGTALLQFGELLAERGASLRDQLAPHRIGLDIVGNYRKTLSYKSLVQVFEGSASAVQLPTLGLELATRQGSTLLGPLQHLARTAATVGEALIAVLRYMSLYSASIHYRLEQRAGVVMLYFDNALPYSTEMPQIVEKSVLHGQLMITELLGIPFIPKAVLFRHQPLSSPDSYLHYFDCPIRFGQGHNALVLRPKDLKQPCIQADATLHEIVRFYLDAQCTPDNNLYLQLQGHIQTLLPRGRCSLEEVARLMSLHSRTLQRRLASSGMDFEVRVDYFRRKQAEQLLQNTNLTVAQIATELGYQRSTSFCRAHHRWFGMTPIEHRLQYQPRFKPSSS
ncbi:AraC family transcriptional regulator [Pseudomonas sp. PDM22]|uniref:AraC family transcriptional regulator n=1 Tax=Pseudomonas sp. PDM22 TaxID=2769287 RepID=UPI001780DF24|nr:AraC family transcriptional regulator [Pseudomonas sp. PDM22]MBD9513676.1 AraC family transcriptional regulator ligand-binding domain-containing protein [Pseudomonas sp. PDM22]